MVLWLKKHRVLLHSLFAFFLAVFFLMPYITKDFLGIEHDTFFHLSRITGLSNALQHKDYFPCIYPLKNNGFGYASPLFYSDIFLYIPSLFYTFGLSLASSYKLAIFLFTFFSIFSLEYLLSKFTKNEFAVFLVSFACTFSNYRITDVYVRGALGEVAAMIFFPLLLSAIYEILYQKNTGYSLLVVSLTGLIFSHNLSFVLGMLVLLLFILINLKNITKTQFLTLFKGCFLAFLLTAFFTLPMLEQTSYQDLYLHYYGSSSSLESYTIPFWKYFANKTVFGYGENTQPSDKAMLVNIGYFLTFIPLLYCFSRKKQKFITHSLILGYIFLLLPSDFIPWKYLSFARILQFPWRLELVALNLLCIPSLEVFRKKRKNFFPILSLIFLCFESIVHIYPVYTRTFGITSQNTYEDITSGKLCNPYYSATYMRVELAGGDYLPLDSVDFRSYSPTIKTIEGLETGIDYTKEYSTLSFTIEDASENRTVVLPVTIYKGYTFYHDEKELPVERYKGLICVRLEGSGSYSLVYKSTLLRNICMVVSFLTLLSVLFSFIAQGRLHKDSLR